MMKTLTMQNSPKKNSANNQELGHKTKGINKGFMPFLSALLFLN